MRTRLRRMRVGEREFAWRTEIRHFREDGGDWRRHVMVRVWGSGRNGRVLVVDLCSTATSVGWDPAATDGAHPTPAGIRRIIERGLAAGWNPEIRGGSFRLTEDRDPDLPGFTVRSDPAPDRLGADRR